MRVLHVFLSDTCGWCERVRGEVDFQDLKRGLGVAAVRLHDVTGGRAGGPFHNSDGPVPHFVVEADGEVLHELEGYVPGGSAALTRAIATSEKRGSLTGSDSMDFAGQCACAKRKIASVQRSLYRANHAVAEGKSDVRDMKSAANKLESLVVQIKRMISGTAPFAKVVGLENYADDDAVDMQLKLIECEKKVIALQKNFDKAKAIIARNPEVESRWGSWFGGQMLAPVKRSHTGRSKPIKKSTKLRRSKSANSPTRKAPVTSATAVRAGTRMRGRGGMYVARRVKKSKGFTQRWFKEAKSKSAK